METPLIITKADFEGRIDISSNLNESKKLKQHILHAQDFDLREVMTNKFYYFFMSFFEADGTIKDSAPDEIKALYSGGSYAIDGVDWLNPGIKPVVVYFAGARLIKGLDNHVTPNGFRTKVNEFSDEVPAARKNMQANEYENQALSYWSMVTTYLENNKTLYPQYFGDSCGCESRKPSSRPRSYAVSGNEQTYHNTNGRVYNRRR